MPLFLASLSFNQHESTAAILLSIVGLIVLLFLLYLVGILGRIFGFIWNFIQTAIYRGFRIWERTLSWTGWHGYLLLVAALLTGGIYASSLGWDWINLLIASLLLTWGVSACMAFMHVSLERYEVARGHKAVYNPTKGQELARHVVLYGERLGPMMLIISAAATIAGFALLNQAIYTTFGASWYRISDPDVTPGYLDFLAFSFVHLLRIVDILDVARTSQLVNIGFVRQGAWPVGILILVFKSFFMLVLVQQIISAIREQRLLGEMIEDFWSPHAPIHDRARASLGQFGPLAVASVLQSLGEVQTLTREQRAALPKVLADIGPLSIDLLQKALRSEKPIVRGVAASALGHLRAYEATPAIAELCGDDNENVRACAVEALGLICESKDLNHLPSTQPPVRQWRLVTFINAVPQLPFVAIRYAWRVCRLLVSGRSALNERSGSPVVRGVAALRLALTDPSAAVRVQALVALGRIGPRAAETVAEVIERMRAGTDQERLFAAEALGRIRANPQSAIPALIEATRDASPPVRAAAATSLAQFKEQAADAGPVLVALLDDSENAVREAATAALGQIGKLNQSAATALEEKLVHPDNLRRAQTAEALGEMGEAARPAAPALVQSLTDDNDLVRGKAAEALGRIGASAADVAVPALAKALDDEDNQVKVQAAKALGEMGEQAADAVPILVKALQNENPEVRTQAAKALGQIDRPETRQHLEEACRDADAKVRASAVTALAQSKEPAPLAPDTLLGLLGDPDPLVRMAAISAAARSRDADPRIASALTALLQDSNEAVATRAMETLPRIGDAALQLALPTMCAWLNEDLSGPKPVAAANALGRFGAAAREAGGALAYAAKTGEVGVRHASVWALSMIRAPESLDALIAALHDESDSVRVQASGGLLKLEKLPDDLLPELVEALHDPHLRVRANAIVLCDRFEALPNEVEALLVASTTAELIALRRNAASVLCRFDSTTVQECLKRLMNDPNPGVRKAAAESLSHLTSEELTEPEVLPAPAEVTEFENDESVVRAAL